MNDVDPHSKSQLYEKAETCVLNFSQISRWIKMKFGILPWPAYLFKLTLFSFLIVHIKERERTLGEFIKSVFKTGLRSDAYGLISFSIQ